MSIVPWDFQLTVNRQAWRDLRDVQSECLQAACGSGKTVMGSHLIEMRLEHAGERCLVIAHRREIVKQTAAKLREAGVSCGIIMADHAPESWERVQVASVDTLWARRESKGFPDAQFVVVDECHRALSMRHTAIINYYKEKGAKILGLTATPMRNDGQGLASMFQRMVKAPDIPWLIARGYLVQPQYRVGIVPSPKGWKVAGGEWNQRQVAEALAGKVLIGSVLENWFAYAKERRTMVFTVGVANSQYLCNEFTSAGVRAAHIDADTAKDVRDRVRADSESGEIQVICNAMVYTEGTDFPWLDCIVDYAPTKSLVKYLQAGWRGGRAYQGKSDFAYHDHSGNVRRHGRLELPRDWELTEGKEMLEKLAEQRKKTEKVQIRCEGCGFMFNAAACPKCGKPLTFSLKGKAREFLPAMLVEMTQWEYDEATKEPPKPKKGEASRADKQEYYSYYLGIARNHKPPLQDGFAAHRYRERFGVWPQGLAAVSGKATESVKKWLAHEAIRNKARAAKSNSPYGKPPVEARV
jgi:DNA repair protein RadD